MGKKTKLAVSLISAVLFLGLGFVWGTNTEKERQKTQEMEEVRVNTIAVVNMDEGVTYQGEHINFASQLMEFPGDNFAVTGLNEAKMGIQGGTYAAYIVIPEDFSGAVTAIETNPKKVLLQYVFHNNLRQETEKQVVEDIDAFKTMLNTNIAYMYVDAILAEVHKVQDDSREIMENDESELAQLQEIEVEALIAELLRPEEERVENNIEPVDSAAYLAENDNILEQLNRNYEESVQSGQADFAQVKSGHEEVAQTSNVFFSDYNSTIGEMKSVNRQLLEAGEKELQEAITLYNQDVLGNQLAILEKVTNIVEIQRISDESFANQQKTNILNSIQEENQNILTTLQEKWQEAYGLWQNYVSQTIETSGQELLRILQGIVDETFREQITVAYEKGAREAIDDVVAGLSVSGGDAGGGSVSGGDAGGGNVSGGDAGGGSVSSGDAGGGSVSSGDAGGGSVSSGDAGGNAGYTMEDINRTCDMVKSGISDHAADYALEADSLQLPKEKLSILEIRLENAVGNDGQAVEKPLLPNPADSQEQILLLRAEGASDTVLEKTSEELVHLFFLQQEKEKLETLIQEKFVEIPTAQNLIEMDSLAEKQSMLLDKMTVYENSLMEYDPLKYLEGANLKQYLEGIGNNSAQLFHEMERNNLEYARYAADVYIASNNNILNFKTAQDDVNAKTASNVRSCIMELQASRQEISMQNREMLGNFAGIVPYTRVGSRENAEVYDYIINPVVGTGIQQMGDKTVERAETEIKDFSIASVLAAIFLVGSLLCTGVMLGKLWKQSRQNRNRTDTSEFIL